jgi:two-component system, cell cycle sensor histidine kinase and response regulator CckA
MTEKEVSQMAVRSMPFAHWRPHWGGALVVLGAAGAVALSAAGHGQAALALLAFLGAGAGVLFAAGQLSFRPAESKIDDRAKRIFSALPAAMAVTDKKGVILWQSCAFSDAVGALGLEQDLSRLGERHSETAAALFRLFAAARDGGSHAETINPPHLANGEPVLLKVSPFKDHAKRSPLLIWSIEQARNAPAASSPKGGTLDLLPVPALLTSKDMTVEAANARFDKLAGQSAAGNQAWTLFLTRRGHPLTRARFRDMIAKADGPVPVQIVTASGFARPASLHLGGPVDKTEGQLWIVTLADTPVEGLEESFAALLARAPMPMAFTNTKGVIHRTNDAFRSLFSAGADGNAEAMEMNGKALASFVAETSSQTVRERIAAFSGDGVAHSGQVEMNAALKESPNKRVRLVIFPTTHESGLIVLAFETGSGSPIDEQAAQSQKLQAVGELAGGIAHDFNNLLTAIIGFSDLLLRRFRASDPAFKDLMNIKNNATRAAELVKQILAYSRRQTLRPAIVKLTDVIEEFQATMGRTLGEKVKARVQHGRDLWFVKADEGQVFQVIMNLAVNARDAMPDGGEITVRTTNVTERESIALKDRGLDRGEYVMCEVRDNGTGIKPEHLEKIFDPFFSTKEVGKGTGLGLSTVYGIVKQTGGTVLVDSEVGVGTSFRIYLPRYEETEEDLKALRSKEEEAPEKIVDLTGRGTVLLVEDEEAVRSFASRALATRGYTVLEAASGVEALEIMDREHGQIDLVVSDVVMPEMDGPTLLRHLRERNPDIRIVFMSGYAEEAFRKNLSVDEDFIFLPKPFTLKKLAETVKAAAA